MTPRILAIAGSDSGGGAGIQADIKTITMLGGHAMTAITAITAQNTVAVTAVMPIPAALVVGQIDAIAEDIGIDAIKIGMIGAPDVAEAVAATIARLTDGRREALPVVLDPVMVASSGARLADPETIAALETLMGRATLITPNAPELAALTGRTVETEAQLADAARALADRVGTDVLAKGGHIAGGIVTDILVCAEGDRQWSDTRIESRHTHGTGCTLSSAIATVLGRRRGLAEAIGTGRAYVRAAIEAAPALGRGHGPMGHGLGRRHFA